MKPKNIPWHSKQDLQPYQQAVRELHLMAGHVEQWSIDDATAKQSKELHLIARELVKIGHRLREIYDKKPVKSGSVTRLEEFRRLRKQK